MCNNIYHLSKEDYFIVTEGIVTKKKKQESIYIHQRNGLQIPCYMNKEKSVLNEGGGRCMNVCVNFIF